MNWETTVEQAEALNYSVRVSTNFKSLTSHVESGLNHLAVETMRHKGRVYPSGAYRDKHDYNLKAIVLSATDAYSTSPDLFVRISLNATRYQPYSPKCNGKGRPKKRPVNPANQKCFTAYHRLSYSYVDKILDALIALEYIEFYKGFYRRVDDVLVTDAEGSESRYKATPKLIQLLQEKHGVQRYMYAELPTDNLIKLLGSDKQPMGFEPTEQTRQWEANLVRYNARLADTYISLNVDDNVYKMIEARIRTRLKDRAHWQRSYIQPLNLHKKSLFRVFSRGDTEQGGLLNLNGRFFGGWWQGVPSGVRKLIMIDGKQTVEVDYSCLHVYLLYALANSPYSEDAYALPEFRPRDRKNSKLAFQAMINIKLEHEGDPKRAEKSAISLIKEYFTTAKAPVEEDSPPASREALEQAVSGNRKSYLPEGYNKLKDVFTAFKIMHKPIAHFFFKPSTGVMLQHLDSQIADAVMQDMLDNNILVLPVHDSFLVAVEHREMLIASMVKNFYLLMGQEPKVKYDEDWDKHSIESLVMPDSTDGVEQYLNHIDLAVSIEDSSSRHLQYKKEYFSQQHIVTLLAS